MLDFGYYNMDCMEGMKQFPDNFFDLAIVDPPYGIKMDGGKIGGDNLGAAKDYIKKDWDSSAPPKEYFEELMRVSKIKLYGAQIILLAGFLLIVVVGLFGIKTIPGNLPIANLRGLLFILQLGNSNSDGTVCCKKI